MVELSLGGHGVRSTGQPIPLGEADSGRSRWRRRRREWRASHGQAGRGHQNRDAELLLVSKE
jgi:hypothetical protein